MTRRLLLATSGAAPSTPDPPPGGGPDPEPNPEWPGWPSSDDPTLLSFRPRGRRTAVATITPADDHNVIATAVKAASKQPGLAESLYWDGDGPDYRGDIIFGPGVYSGGGGGGGWACYVGATGDPADTIIQADGGSGGVVYSFGSQYLEGLTLRAYSSDGDTSPKYPWHISGGPVTIAQNCVFDVRDAVEGQSEIPGANRTAGIVGKDASVLTVFYRCTFIADPTTNMGGFNMHGAQQPELFPETMLFIDCETIGVQSLGGTGQLSIAGERSRIYIIGLTHDEHLTSIGGDAKTDLYTDSDLPAGGGTVYRDVSGWPEIVNGMLVELDEHFYPSALGGGPTNHTLDVVDAAPMRPVPGRTYVTRVPVTPASRITHSGVGVTTAAGQLMLRHTPADTETGIVLPPDMTPLTPNQDLVVGANEWKHSYYYTRYPGTRGIWSRVKFTSGGARVIGSAELAGMAECYYTDDDVTLVPVEPGTPHPIPYVASAGGTYVPVQLAPGYISVFGDSPPPGTHTLYTDNGEPIVLAQTFRRSTGSPISDNAQVMGGRVYLPSPAPDSTHVKIMLWEGDLDLASTPDREVVVPLNGASGWVEGIFEEPFPIPGIFSPYRVGYTFVGEPATYIYAPDFRSGAVAVSPQANGIEITEGFSSYRSGSGGTGSPASVDVGYGVDILISDVVAL